MFLELVTWPWVCPDDVIIGVIDHEKVKTEEINLNWLNVMKLYDSKFSLSTAQKDQLMAP